MAMSYLRYLCLLTRSGAQHILCCVFCLIVWCFFGGLSSSCVHNATSLSGLSIFDSVSYNVYLPLFTIIEEFEDTKGGNQNPYIEEEQIT